MDAEQKCNLQFVAFQMYLNTCVCILLKWDEKSVEKYRNILHYFQTEVVSLFYQKVHCYTGTGQ